MKGKREKGRSYVKKKKRERGEKKHPDEPSISSSVIPAKEKRGKEKRTRS